MSIYIGATELKSLKKGTSDISEVYVGGTKVRPLIKEMYVCFLLVGGGGAGGYGCSSSSGGGRPGGGGGAGGVVQCCNQCISSGTYCINVGDGGKGCNNYCNGYDTTGFGITAYGGGGGGMNNKVGGNGGSGGGAGFCGVYGCGCSGQGNNGGTYLGTGCLAGAGGGGGYCGVGGNAYGTGKYDKRGNEYRHGGDGGQGVDIVIGNGAMTFSGAGGGGGGTHYYNYEGVNSCSGCYGSGGRGGHGQNEWGEQGIQGVAYIWYPQGGVEATGGTKTCGCGYVIHEFTESGEFSF